MNFLTLLCDFNHQSTVFCSVILQDVPNPDSVILVKTALFQAWWEPWNWNVLPPYIYTHNCTHMHIHTHTTHTHIHTYTISSYVTPSSFPFPSPFFSPGCMTMSGSKRRSWSKVFKCRGTECQRREVLHVAVIPTKCHLYWRYWSMTHRTTNWFVFSCTSRWLSLMN